MYSAASQDSATAYRLARRSGRRFVAEQHGLGRSGLLPILEPLLDEICGEIPMGHLEIPIKKIRGTYAAGRSSAFAGNFMPLLSENSEFAGKWTALYDSSMTEGIHEPVKAYEYLGYYYIAEGNKRVSVLSYCGGYSVRGEVTRLMPPDAKASVDHMVFYEILGGDRRKPITHMWFSAPGRMTELRDLAKKARAKNPDLPEDLTERAFALFRAEYHKLGYNDEIDGITTGDAFFQYALIYGFPADTAIEELSRNLKNCRPMLDVMGGGESRAVLRDPSELPRRPVFSFFSRGAKLSVLFAYCGTPMTNMSAAAHDVGRFSLEREFPSVDVAVVDGLPYGAGCYEELSFAVKELSPDLLLATDPSMGQAALRLTLDFRDTLVMHCHYRDLGVLNTYSAKTEEPAFMVGALAASVSAGGLIGYLRPPTTLGGRTYNMQAFAQGARLIRPAARVFFAAPERGRPESADAMLSKWSDMGVDAVFLPNTTGKSFPGAFGHLFKLSCGVPTERLATTAWHWDEFYKALAKSILDGSADLFPAQGALLHFNMGLSSGVVDAHPVYPALPQSSFRLLEYLRHLIWQGMLLPIDEDDPAEVVETVL